MLSTDTRILNVLLNSQKEGNKLLNYFKIKYPDKTLTEDVNSIHVACVSSENHTSGEGFQVFTDLVEIVITTKKLEYSKAIRVIKTVSKEIINLLKKDDYLSQRIIVRSISPIHDSDTFLLKKGHLLLQFNTDPISFMNSDDEIEKVCKFLIDDIDEV
ncbi:hypothetical protein [Methanobrevibacter woesei]|uniref:hypothetical protein n=1 Tax=Methanobrevibacter woesei TaxID=190976 RepID=UPI0024B6B9B8|nr:hypothetical protein [Methanobrevibacter woesei]